ncbi:MAG: hypothetical protein KDB80_14145 [Planctomycetes bacterium]|nr:hypothetical protein [Planctomycetota bacterium]
MKRPTAMLLAASLGFVTAGLTAQVGGKVPDANFESFGNTEATSLADFEGRLILLEAFAYW